MAMKTWSSRLNGMAEAAGADSLASLCESYARCGIVYAKLLRAFADGTDGWMKRRRLEDQDPAEDVDPHELMSVLRLAGWIGELNVLLDVLIAKHRRVLPRLREAATDRERLRSVEPAVSALWDSCAGWGVTLCRLLRLLCVRMQRGERDGGIAAPYVFASMMSLHQLHDLLVLSRRWRAQCMASIRPCRTRLPRRVWNASWSGWNGHGCGQDFADRTSGERSFV